MMVMSPGFDKLEGKPLIVYPCRWEYKVIGLSEDSMRAAIAEIVAGLEHTLTFSNASREGKYCSLLLAVTVASEEHRNEIFAALQNHPDIRMVL